MLYPQAHISFKKKKKGPAHAERLSCDVSEHVQMRCVCEVVFYWSALLAVGFETAVHLNTINENRTYLPNGLTSLYEFSDKVMYLIIIATRSLTVTFFFTCTLRHLPCVFFLECAPSPSP